MDNVSYNAMSEARALDIHVQNASKQLFSIDEYIVIHPLSSMGGVLSARILCSDTRSGSYEYLLIEQSEY